MQNALRSRIYLTLKVTASQAAPGFTVDVLGFDD